MEPFFNLLRPLKGLATTNLVFEKTALQALPSPTGKAPYHLDIKKIISPAKYADISHHKRMSFHLTGDVGGIKNPADQVLVADHMEMQFDELATQDTPAFLYIAGDVVYYYGQLSEYNSQFYEPYKFYPAPIFAIPGNHDGDIDPTEKIKPKSLDAFVKFFCAKKILTPPEAGDSLRTTMIQPNVYWTLVTPVANIIGLYTNVPEGGRIDAQQQKWFIEELITANKERKDKALIVTLHHPPYSMDAHHGASERMEQFLDAAFKESNVLPDIVFSAHVHNYQRFTKKINEKEIPYIVAGSGGYWHLHNINTSKIKVTAPGPTPFNNVIINSYCEDRHGFLYVSVDMKSKIITGKYFTVPRMQESWKAQPVLFDTFKVDLALTKML